MFDYLKMDQLEVDGRQVLVRSDLNVPIESGQVGDDFRIQAAIPTWEKLRERGADITVCSHLGRPKGRDPELSMEPVAARISDLTGWKVKVGEPGADLTLLENTRFDPGETENDPETADRLANGFDLFVQDAFGSIHRAHASTVGVAERVESAAGPLLDSELQAFGRFLGEPERPYTVVLGGAKVSDKLGVVRKLLPKVDRMLIGGGMCFTFLAAKGLEVGNSMVDEEKIDDVKRLLEGPDGKKIILPVDVAVADRFAEDARRKVVGVFEIPRGWLGLDIGPRTSGGFRELIDSAANVFWNGPMGVFEWEAFRKGTDHVARALAACDGFTAVGGGDSAAALRLLGLESSVSHLSTGGGAGLELLEGRVLPGVAVLERWVK